MTAQALGPSGLELAQAIESSAGSYCWTRGDWLGSLEKDCCFVWLDSDQPVAVAVFSVVFDEVNLLNIAVRAEVQRRGIARQFLQHCLGEFAEQGMKHCFLEVRRSNRAALELYRQLGFNGIGERKNYYPVAGGREDALVLLCRINQHQQEKQTHA